LWVLAGVVFGLSLQTALAVFFFYLLLILSFIDIDLRRLPNTLLGLLFGIGLTGVLISQFTPLRALPLLSVGRGPLVEPLVFAIVGALASAGLMLGIALGYERLRHKQGLGMGDIKLLAVMGLYLGAYALLALFFATICGAAYGLAVARLNRDGGRQAFPFGPFLALGCVATVAFGPAVWNWYLALLH
jgi:leader peptidase (prepilin peptidase)/N-methyltransferase